MSKRLIRKLRMRDNKLSNIMKSFSDKEGYVSIQTVFKFFVWLIVMIKDEKEYQIIYDYVRTRTYNDGYEWYDLGYNGRKKLTLQYIDEPELELLLASNRKDYEDITRDYMKKLSTVGTSISKEKFRKLALLKLIFG